MDFECKVNVETDTPKRTVAHPAGKTGRQTQTKIIYFTDPICSACWAIEPYLRKLKILCGKQVPLEYKMGGLLPAWKGFSDPNHGIRVPADVGPHWNAVGKQSGMSIDGDLWYERPLLSSYPASLAYYAARMQSEKLADRFYRRIREGLFLEKQDLMDFRVLQAAATAIGLDPERFRADFESRRAEQMFSDDLRLKKAYKVRRFPTWILQSAGRPDVKLTKITPWDSFVKKAEKVFGKIDANPAPFADELAVLAEYDRLATVEIAVLLNKQPEDSEHDLEALCQEGKVRKLPFKYGNFWTAQTKE